MDKALLPSIPGFSIIDNTNKLHIVFLKVIPSLGKLSFSKLLPINLIIAVLRMRPQSL